MVNKRWHTSIPILFALATDFAWNVFWTFSFLLRFVEPCVEFLERQAKSLDLTYNVYRLFDAKAPIVVMSWIGAQPTLPAIMLNSHMDVVPAYPEQWSHPPFAANIDENGRIYARGSQDMKGIGMQYLAAIRELKKAGQTFKRTIHVIFVPGKFWVGLLISQRMRLTCFYFCV